MQARTGGSVCARTWASTRPCRRRARLQCSSRSWTSWRMCCCSLCACSRTEQELISEALVLMPECDLQRQRASKSSSSMAVPTGVSPPTLFGVGRDMPCIKARRVPFPHPGK